MDSGGGRYVPLTIMNGMSVPNATQPAAEASAATPTVTEAAAALDALAAGLDAMTPETRKAATYLLEHPAEVGVSTVREIADAAGVKPNTLVRMARIAGFEGYEEFRAPFREALRRGPVSFPDRARWLQSVRRGGRMGALYADMAAAAIRNLEETFAGIDEARLRAAADAILASREVFVLGVGVNHANASNFAYLASTGMDRFHAIPRAGSTATDDLARSGPEDVVIAITCKPYRREVVDAVGVAREQGVRVIGISDSPASPIVIGSAHGFVVAADTPQFFPSSVSTVALLETLLSFVIAAADPEIVARVERFHARRHALGLYVEDSR